MLIKLVHTNSVGFDELGNISGAVVELLVDLIFHI